RTGEISDDKALVMHVELADGFHARADIVNLFKQGSGDSITFPKAGFEVSECLVNGKVQNLAEYLSSRKVDLQLPLVADYMGAMINVSIERLDAELGKVI